MEDRLVDILLSLVLMEPVEFMGVMVTRWPNDMFELNTIGDAEFSLEETVCFLLDHSATYTWGPNEEPLDVKFLSVCGVSFEA